MREIQVEATEKYSLILIPVTAIKKTKDNECCGQGGEGGISVQWHGNINSAHNRDHIVDVPQKLKYHTT